MKRLSLLITIAMSFLVWQAMPVLAASTTYTVSATLPAATGVSFTASSVAGTPPVFTPVTGTGLSFDPLTFNTTNKIWLPNHFFAIDIAPTGGAGSANTNVTYTEGGNPNINTTGHGLGYKTTATFIKVAGTPTTETVLSAHGKKRLIDLNNEFISSSEVSGGYLRIYVGIVTKDPAATPPDPTNSEPFTNADFAGNYNGQLMITSTQV